MPDETPPGGDAGSADPPPYEPPAPPDDPGPSWSPVPPEAPPAPPAPSPAPPAPGFSAGDPLGGTPAPAAPVPPVVPEPAGLPAMPAPAAPPVPAAPPSAMPQAPAVPPPYGGPPPGFQQPAQPGFGSYELSGWWRRAFALIIDSLIVGALAFVVALVTFAIVGAAGAADSSFASASAGVLIVVLFLGYLAAAILYQPIIMARTNGKTFGKMATGIQVVRVNGERVDFGYSALRQVVVIGLLFGWVGSFFLGIPLLLDYLWPLWDSENRALHDMLVQSRVVRA